MLLCLHLCSCKLYGLNRSNIVPNFSNDLFLCKSPKGKQSFRHSLDPFLKERPVVSEKHRNKDIPVLQCHLRSVICHQRLVYEMITRVGVKCSRLRKSQDAHSFLLLLQCCHRSECYLCWDYCYWPAKHLSSPRLLFCGMWHPRVISNRNRFLKIRKHVTYYLTFGII